MKNTTYKGQPWFTKWFVEEGALAWLRTALILAEAGYPDALLLNGSRSMTGDLLPTTNQSLGSWTKHWLKAWLDSADVNGAMDIAGSILPKTDLLPDLGSILKRWNNVYALNLVGLVPNSGYPNALLLDGTRAMTGALNVGEIAKGITFGSAGCYIQGETVGGQHVLRFVSEDELFFGGNIDFGGQFVLRSYFAHYPGSDAAANFYFNPQDCASKTSWIKLRNPSWGWETLVSMIADADGACRFEINQAGNITMLTDKMIQLSHESTGAAANAGNRGKLRMVQGGAGVADKTYQCMKAADESYSWVEVATG